MSRWKYALNTGGTSALIVESDGTTVARLTVTENTTAHSVFETNLKLMSSAPEVVAERDRLRGHTKALLNLARLVLGGLDSGAIKAKRVAIPKLEGEDVEPVPLNEVIRYVIEEVTGETL